MFQFVLLGLGAGLTLLGHKKNVDALRQKRRMDKYNESLNYKYGYIQRSQERYEKYHEIAARIGLRGVAFSSTSLREIEGRNYLKGKKTESRFKSNYLNKLAMIDANFASAKAAQTGKTIGSLITMAAMASTGGGSAGADSGAGTSLMSSGTGSSSFYQPQFDAFYKSQGAVM